MRPRELLTLLAVLLLAGPAHASRSKVSLCDRRVVVTTPIRIPGLSPHIRPAVRRLDYLHGYEQSRAALAGDALPPPAPRVAGKKRSRRVGSKEILLSLALPGLGELRTGHRNRAVMHFAAEAAVWASFIVFRVQGELRKDDYIEFASVFAGVQDAGGQSDEYYRDLAKYIRSDPGPGSYNEREVRATARALYPDDLEARHRYVNRNEIHGARAWNWETEEEWFKYGSMRESSELSFQRSRFAIGAAVANRIASVLGLTRTRVPGGSNLDVGLRRTAGGRPAAAIALSRNF